jgi:hypothetical protein
LHFLASTCPPPSGHQPRIILERAGNVLRIAMPKFRERQAKLKSKIPPTFRQDSAKTPQEGEYNNRGRRRAGARRPPQQAKSAPDPDQEAYRQFLKEMADREKKAPSGPPSDVF